MYHHMRCISVSIIW